MPETRCALNSETGGSGQLSDVGEIDCTHTAFRLTDLLTIPLSPFSSEDLAAKPTPQSPAKWKCYQFHTQLTFLHRIYRMYLLTFYMRIETKHITKLLQLENLI